MTFEEYYAAQNQPSTAETGTAPPIETAVGGESTTGPGASYYVGQNNGSVTTGHRNFLETAVGIDKTHVDAAQIPTLADAGDVAAIDAAKGEYGKQHDAWKVWAQDQVRQLGERMQHGIVSNKEIDAVKDNVERSEPKPPDLTAVEHVTDRNRLINMGSQYYQPLISSLQLAAAGQGPSAAIDTYRQAADDASKRNYGLAASARGTGGQRAALFQSALGQNAMDAQGAARQAGILRAQEQNAARTAETAALAGLTDVYGRANLLGDTAEKEGRNLDSANNALSVNADISRGNQKVVSDKLDKGIDTAAKGLGA